jgi:hypothetical protein
VSETRQDLPDADPPGPRRPRAPGPPPPPGQPRHQPRSQPRSQPRTEPRHQPRAQPRTPPSPTPPTPPYGTRPAPRTVPPTPPYGTPVPGAPDYGRSGPTYGPGHRDGWAPRTEPESKPALPYPPTSPRRSVPKGLKLLVGAGLVFAALLVLGRLTDLPAGPFTDTFGRTSVQESSDPGPGTTDDGRAVSADEWAAIARDPEAHQGETVLVTGRVTRLWTAGDGAARATVGGSLPSGARTAVTPVALVGERETFRSLHLHDEVELRAVVQGAGGDRIPPDMPVLKVERSSVLDTR